MTKGVFDSTSNKKYNNAKPNYDIDDGVDNHKCDQVGCCYRDTHHERCLFETCIYNQHPFSIPYHSKFTRNCKFCDKPFTVEYGDDSQSPLTEIPCMCEGCFNKLRLLILK